MIYEIDEERTKDMKALDRLLEVQREAWKMINEERRKNPPRYVDDYHLKYLLTKN